MNSEFTLAAMFAALLVLLLTGLPLAFVLGSLALAFTLILWGSSALVLPILQIFDTMRSEMLLAIPLYVLMATILQRSGIIDALYRSMELWFGRLPGGLAVGTIVICTIMAAMTGIVGAAVAAMGILALPSMLARGYNPRLAVGTICAGGTLGILIPPSVITIVYAVTAQTSIGQMFIGGVVPGLILSTLYVTYIVTMVALNPAMAPTRAAASEGTLWEKLASLRALLLPALIIAGVLGSIYAGIATPTEAAAIGVLFCLLSAALQGRLTLGMLSECALETIRVTTMILWITIAARSFVVIFTGTGGADFLLDFIRGFEADRWVILAVMLAMLFFLGMFLDEIGIILLCVPVFLPIINYLGFDPLWFGILFLISAQMAYISPPFGYTLFYMKGVAPKSVRMETIYLGIIPFILLQLVGLTICAIWPELVLWLPRTMIEAG